MTKEQYIAKCMKDTGVRMTHVARLTGIKYAALHSIVTGRRYLRVNEFFVLCEFFGKDPNEVWRECKKADRSYPIQ